MCRVCVWVWRAAVGSLVSEVREVPLAFGAAQTAPLGRAVIGGLLGATLATLFVLPSFFALVQARARSRSVSLDPYDPASTFYTS